MAPGEIDGESFATQVLVAGREEEEKKMRAKGYAAVVGSEWAAVERAERIGCDLRATNREKRKWAVGQICILLFFFFWFVFLFCFIFHLSYFSFVLGNFLYKSSLLNTSINNKLF